MRSAAWIGSACFASQDPTGLLDPPPFRTVLVEAHDGAIVWAQENVLTRAGFRVVSCPGPRGFTRHGCPLVTDGACDLVDAADVVLTSMSAADPQERCVLEALGSLGAGPPVVVNAPQPMIDEEPGLFAGFRVLPEPATRDATLEAVRSAVR